MTQDAWFICTKDFVCKKCGRSNSITHSLKASKPLMFSLILTALKDLSLQCVNQECREPLPGTDDWTVVEATPAETEVFESNPKSQRS